MSRVRCDLEVRGRLVLGGRAVRRGLVLVRGGRVLWSGPAARAPSPIEATRTLGAPGATIVPGFLDLHVHGGGGRDVVEGTTDALRRVCCVHAGHGTTALCATVLSASPETMLRALGTIREAAWLPAGSPGERDRRGDRGRGEGEDIGRDRGRGEGEDIGGDRGRDGDGVGEREGARVLGSHLEGPFLNPACAGAQPAERLRAPDPVLLEELLAAAGPTLRIMTLAPEIPGALDLVARLAERGVVPAMGHSAATFAEARAAIDAGVRLATHTFNAMRPLHHREVGLAGAALLCPEVFAEVIADGHHLCGPVLELLWRLKGPDRLALVTDCTAALQAGPAGARLGGRPVQLDSRGAVRLADGTLAGSALTMERAVSNLASLGRVPLTRAVAAATSVPARVLGLQEQLGDLQPGMAADLVLLDRELAVQRILIGGRLPGDGQQPVIPEPGRSDAGRPDGRGAEP